MFRRKARSDTGQPELDDLEDEPSSATGPWDSD
jgi:hypothetical protein